MERLFFVAASFGPKPTAPAMERALYEEACKQFMHHLIKEADLDEIVSELNERQQAYTNKDNGTKRVIVNYNDIPESCCAKYINIGNSQLICIEVKGEIPKN